MPKFYFDVRDGDEFYPDPEGAQKGSFEAARTEAVRALGDMARDAVPRAGRNYVLSIDVCDETHRPIYRVAISYLANPLP